MSAQSAGLGQGTEFTIRLPAVDLPVSATVATVLVSEVTPQIGPEGSRVLVVDDNEDAAEMIAEALVDWGYVVRVAHD